MPKRKTKKKTIKPKKPIQLLRGFRDILPEEQFYWDKVRKACEKIANDYSFERIDLPMLEATELFERGIGSGTDIVDKEMFTFKDNGGDMATMRPEATAQIVRAYVEHGMLNKPQPVKMWYEGPMFRYERPQAGRYRQFHQFGVETIGSEDPIIDAQTILIIDRLLKELGLSVKVRINSIGTSDTRADYVKELTAYFKKHKADLADVDKDRLKKNPLRLLDSKEKGMEELKKDAPQIADWLDEDSRAHFMKVLEYLEDADVHFEIDPFMVRGLDYYGKTVFEFVEATDDKERSQNALGGGGRYDDLLPMLGVREEITGGMGAAIGIERVIIAMKEAGITPPKVKEVDVFFCQLGEGARKQGLLIFEEFRTAGISIAEAFGKGSLKAQLDVANKRKAKVALILGQKEVLDGTIIVRDMESGGQEIVNVKKVVSATKKALK